MTFISASARRCIEDMFHSALLANIAPDGSSEVSISLPEDPSGKKAETPRNLVVLTCASLRFKLVVILQVVDEPLARACFSGGNGAQDPMEVLLERGNLCCGALNRELLKHVPHIGLSTPSKLRGLPSKVVAALKPEHVASSAVLFNGDHVLNVSLCMRGQAPVDFVADAAGDSAEASGELELL